MIFKKKKIYRIVYRLLNTHVAIIEAKDERQAMKKFYKKFYDKALASSSIISITEFNIKGDKNEDNY